MPPLTTRFDGGVLVAEARCSGQRADRRPTRSGGRRTTISTAHGPCRVRADPPEPTGCRHRVDQVVPDGVAALRLVNGSERRPRNWSESTQSISSVAGSASTSSGSRWVRAMSVSARARAAPRQKCGPKPKATWPLRVAGGIEHGGVVAPPARVTVGRAEQQCDVAVVGQLDAVALDGARRPPEHVLDRRLPAQRLVDDRRHAGRVGCQPRSSSSGWASRAATALPMRFVDVSVPAKSSRAANPTASSRSSTSSPWARTSVVSRSSRGSQLALVDAASEVVGQLEHGDHRLRRQARRRGRIRSSPASWRRPTLGTAPPPQGRRRRAR